MYSTKDCFCICLCLIFTSIVVIDAAVCPLGYYGDRCQNQCSRYCSTMKCHNLTGACEGACEDGWTGLLCDTPCSNRTYGYNCSKSCPDNCLNGLCQSSNGACTDGCKKGYRGEMCQATCPRGVYGEGCRSRCPQNCEDVKCHHVSGYCTAGCKDGFWGSDCTLFGNIKEAPEETQVKFYNNLSAESKSVLLYVLMGEYERTLGKAQEEIRRGIQQRNEIRRLIG